MAGHAEKLAFALVDDGDANLVGLGVEGRERAGRAGGNATGVAAAHVAPADAETHDGLAHVEHTVLDGGVADGARRTGADAAVAADAVAEEAGVVLAAGGTQQLRVARQSARPAAQRGEQHDAGAAFQQRPAGDSFH